MFLLYQVDQKSPDGHSDTESFVEVSESDIKEATEAMKHSTSYMSEHDDDTLTTVSLTSETSRLEEPGGYRRSKSVSPCPQQQDGEKKEKSRQYVTEFLDKYVLDTRTDSQVSFFLNYFYRACVAKLYIGAEILL